MVLERLEGVHFEAGSGPNPGRGGLPSGWDQPGDLPQLEKETGRAAADQDEPAQAGRGRQHAQDPGRRPLPRQGDAAGRDPPKTE